MATKKIKKKLLKENGQGVAPITSASAVIMGAEQSGGSKKTLQQMVDNGEFLTGPATADKLGGIKAANRTTAETEEVKKDPTTHKLYVKPGGGGGGTISQATETSIGGIKAAPRTANETVEAKIDPQTGKIYVPAGGGTTEIGTGNITLAYTTNRATTRKLVPASDRKPGLIVSYKDPAGWVAEQFVGLDTIDDKWGDDVNWESVKIQLSSPEGIADTGVSNPAWVEREILGMYDFTKYPDGHTGPIDNLTGGTLVPSMGSLAGYTSGRNGFVGGKYMVNPHKTSGLASTLGIKFPDNLKDRGSVTVEVYAHLRRAYDPNASYGVMQLYTGSVTLTNCSIFRNGNRDRFYLNQTQSRIDGVLSDPSVTEDLPTPIKIDGVDDSTITDTYHHIVVISSSERRAIFVDGVKVIEAKKGSETYNGVTVGLFNGGQLYGDIKMLRVYNTALTDEEVLTNYTSAIDTYNPQWVGRVKKLKINGVYVYPVGLTSSVFLQGTDKTLEDAINNGDLFGISSLEQAKAILGDITPQCKNYKGKWVDGLYRTGNSFRTTCSKGDFWIHNELQRYNVDTSILQPYGIVYFDGEYFRTIRVPILNNIKPKPFYDVVIAGGGAGGIGAAFALKDAGWNVAIIDRLDRLGGTHCHGVGLLIPSPSLPWYKPWARQWFEEGIYTMKKQFSTPLYGVGDGDKFDKVYRAAQFTDGKNVVNGFAGNYRTFSDYKLSQRYFEILTEAGVDVLLNTELIETHSSVAGERRNVDYITCRNVYSGKVFNLNADYFIESTADAELFVRDKNLTRGVDYYIGSDPRDRFNESVYPVGFQGNEYDINTVEQMYWMASIYGPTAIPPHPTRYKYFSDQASKSNFGYTPYGDYSYTSMSNSSGGGMSLRNFIDKPVSYALGEGYARSVSFFLHHSYQNAANRHSGTAEDMLAIREKFRVAAEETVDANSLAIAISPENYRALRTVALSTWWVDVHNAGYFVTSNIPNGVPVGALISKAYGNVVLGSRCYGASHIGLSSLRLVPTIKDIGYAAGSIILQLLERANTGKTARGDVRTVDVEALQDSIGIADTLNEVYTYFMKPMVSGVDYVQYAEDHLTLENMDTLPVQVLRSGRMAAQQAPVFSNPVEEEIYNQIKEENGGVYVRRA